MKKIIIFIILILNTINLFAKELIFLTVPQQTQITTSNHEQIWVENKKTINLSDKGNSIVIQAKAKGICNIQIGYKYYLVVVGSKAEFDQYQKLASLLRFLPKLHIGYENNQFVIEGKITEQSDWLSLAKLQNTNWILKSEASDEIVLKIEELINQELLKNNFQNIQIVKNPYPVIKVPKDIIDKSTPGIHIIKKYGISLEKDDDILNIEPLIRVKMTLAEVRTEELEKYGIKLPNEYSTSVLNNSSLSNLSKNANLEMSFLESHGKGKILATPVLLSKSGSESTFLAGGEIPIKLISARTHEVVWKKYGIQLKVKPQADALGHIKMDIEAEVSSLDHTQAVDGIPALLTNSVQSHFDLQKSQTLILSGLVKHIDSETVHGWPGLIQLPILGQLFSSTDFQQNKTEMIVFVTPEIIRN